MLRTFFSLFVGGANTAAWNSFK